MTSNKEDIFNSIMQQIASQTIAPQQQFAPTPAHKPQQQQSFPSAASLFQNIAADTVSPSSSVLGQKTPRGIRNNNPGNIRDAGFKWKGMIGAEAVSNTRGTRPFVKFESPEFGIRALARDLTTKRNRGLDTINKIISVYAPPIENKTGAYARAVSKSLDIPVDKKLDLDHETLVKLVKAVIFHENGMQPYSDETIQKGVQLSK